MDEKWPKNFETFCGKLFSASFLAKNMFWKRKKTLFFLGFLALALLCCVFFALNRGQQIITFKKAPPEALSVAGEGIKTPCRFLKQKPRFSSPSLDRREKLDHLMNKPLDWVFKDIHGNVIDIHCLRGNKILVLNFWATWCPPCIEELPSLARLAEQFNDRLFVLALSAEPKAKLLDFTGQAFLGLSPSLKVASIAEEEKALRFPEDPLPVTYVFGKNGLLLFKKHGAADWLQEGLVRRLLNSK